MKPIIRDARTIAYVRMVLLVAIFMLLFTAVTHGQELPNAPQAAVQQHVPPVHKQRPQLAKAVGPLLGSADWFREHGLFKLARIMPVLTHIDFNPSYDKPKGADHGIRKSR
jgi:hypothetical protein